MTHCAKPLLAFSALERLGRGATFLTEPRDQPVAFIRTAHLRDPAGHLIEINSPLQHPPQNKPL